jgi:glycosyltransferase involved in cell wall biosynthesis
MEYPKVSIITPSYNRGHLIEDTIRSVLNQTYTKIEYIVVDGMSTDNTVEILEKYREKGVLRYISEKDEGMYYAINKGIRMAHGNIIAYLNSDDRYFPWTVQKAVEVFQKYNEVDMIFGDSYVIDVSTNRTHMNIYASYKKYWLPLGGVICQPTVFLRRGVFDEVGFFNTGFRYLADCEFWHRINNKKNMKIRKVDEVMAMEYNHDGTIRQIFKNEIKSEKDRLTHMYGREYFGGEIRLFMLRLFRERKLWKFILINLTKKNIHFNSWRNFLTAYNANINLFQYFLHKLYILPSFVKKVRKGEGMI